MNVNAKSRNAKIRNAIPLAVALLVWASTVPTTHASSPTSCVNYDDDWGFGGSDVDCHLPCKEKAILLIAAHATDVDASIVGKYNCGEQAAGCSSSTNLCAGSSEYLTTKAEDAYCEAESDEFWSSMVYVACANVVVLPAEADPLYAICRIVGDTFPPCQKHGPGASIMDIRAACLEQVPSLQELGPSALAELFPVSFVGHEISSLRSIAYFPDGSIVNLFVPDTLQPDWVCLNTN